MKTIEMTNSDCGDAAILHAFERAAGRYRFCPNRVWAVAQTLLGKEQNLPFLFPQQDDKVANAFDLLRDNRNYDHDDHNSCTYKKCEISQLNFTSVPQRHESGLCRREGFCYPTDNKFPTDRLDSSAQAGGPTAWHLNGRSIIGYNQKFMAISHVWSDGTGTGAWGEGQVNSCLYGFFASIARQLGCQGIWWDTICIPKDKAARAKAISYMHENYENAELTLVHDCFLRNLEWIDAETACLAIVMSPWFSRGWTALELAKSRKVKVLFKQGNALVLKDLDQDLLKLRGSTSERHKILISAIAQLRSRRITDLGPLLNILGSRYTSWARDMAVIAGLLVDVAVEPALNSSDGLNQQEIYQNVLQATHTLRHGHLFHNSPTMFRGFSWCPANLFDMPTVAIPGNYDEFLQIRPNGDLLGIWNMINVDSVASDSYIWKDVNALVEPRLRLALNQQADHVYLVEPGLSTLTRALLARKHRTDRKAVQFIGSMNFHPPQIMHTECQETVIRILHSGSVERQDARATAALPRTNTQNRLAERRELGYTKAKHLLESRSSELPARLATDGREDVSTQPDPSLLHMVESQLVHEIRESMDSRRIFQDRDSSKRTFLSRAAANGDFIAADMILSFCEELLVLDGEATPSVRANASPLRLRRFFEAKDNKNMTALSWAAQEGYLVIVEKLILWHEVDINSTSHPRDVSGLPLTPQGPAVAYDLATPLFLAAKNGHAGVVKALLRTGANPNGVNRTEWPLYAAAASGHPSCIILLLRAGARPHVSGTYNNYFYGSALALAFEHKREQAAEVLIRSGLKIKDSDASNLKSLVFSAISWGNAHITELLLNTSEWEQSWLNSWLSDAASEGHPEIVDLFLRKGADINSINPGHGPPLVIAAGGHRHGPSAFLWMAEEDRPRNSTGSSIETVKLLLERGADVNITGGYHGSALQAAAAAGNIDIAELLIRNGANVKFKGGHYGSAMKAAKANKHKEMVKLLQKHGGLLFGW